MRSRILYCSRLINRSLVPCRSRNISLQRCLCDATSDRGQSGKSLEQGAKPIQDLLDEAAQGLGPWDKETEDDEWHTSPYPEGAVINPRQSQSAKSLRPSTDPSDTSIILFPGYGSQYVGMGRELTKFPKARDIFDASSAILKLDVLKMMLNGPKHTLNELKYADPLIFISSLAALEKLKEERPWAIENCVATAGFSVGEITALTFAGVFSFSDGLKFVRARAEAIEFASDLERGGMAIIHYNASSKLKLAISKAKEWCLDRGINDPECVVATYLNPNMKVIAGHVEALAFIEENLKEFKLGTMSPVSIPGAVHTRLMKPASDVLRELLIKMELSEPSTHIYSNVTGKRYGNLENVWKYLPKQICKPMLWEQMIHKLFDRGPNVNIPSIFTCGPKSPALKNKICRINTEASKKCVFVF